MKSGLDVPHSLNLVYLDIYTVDIFMLSNTACFSYAFSTPVVGRYVAHALRNEEGRSRPPTRVMISVS